MRRPHRASTVGAALHLEQLVGGGLEYLA